MSGYLQADAVSCEAKATWSYKTCRASTLRAWWSLLLTVWQLRGNNFARVYSKLSDSPKPPAMGTSIEVPLERAERAFRLAENFFLMRKAPRDCLPRSLALYRFLLGAGIPANHVIGVHRYPFEAHAWVEANGRVICDSTYFVSGFTELARL